MSYQVLARKWRPKSFDALVGQEHVVRALHNALEQQRLHHAYLFTGTRGVGKTTLSRILAKSLNCETGITATPCGKCSACVGIDQGSFIDYVEMDAASNRGIDDMTALLEKAIYAPTQGRFKVYMLDEVHQLTGHAFNAMLKTLEEPPAHVKFILATTDPQKVPVTVLSRCLQFNLRQLSASVIAEHMQTVLAAEQIPAELAALQLLARAAAGSMRDALSLLDQAIAYGGDKVSEAEVRQMLGAIDQRYLFALLQALLRSDGSSLLQQVREMEQRSISFSTALSDLANLLYQIALAQTVPGAADTASPDHALLQDMAAQINAEQVQLFYQIAILGKRDLGLAPDEAAGFSMCMLRMLAFMPGEKAGDKRSPAPSRDPAPAGRSTEVTQTLSRQTSAHASDIAAEISPAPSKAVESSPRLVRQAESAPRHEQHDSSQADGPSSPAADPTTAVAAPDEAMDLVTAAIAFDGNWRGLVDQLKLGLARALAQHCELSRYDGNAMYLNVPQAHSHLLNQNYQQKLSQAISQHFDRPIKLHFSSGGGDNTPAALMGQERARLQSEAEHAIRQDDFVQALVNDFGAQIIPSSIRPIQ
ncbi:DNA polymerase III subunit gamma/tau [Pseudomethylobacillus aquaticus]|uniref:DNA polymerase III subunit gamma/tau n=1 Tax=Pseudomethylobacillus aquaticus TaxID=2676064 RepID=A0A3N0UY27_9PROT|nr:DNA polymerase III subunit gamma/tau [Pseudomethylobacillus aquaticus]ROH85469.1 DNA polymerase III subunit gamma/tau [Pseudomethylobacillus aquaticus]